MIGHAFEARIYAENVARGFLPATGTLHHYQPVSVSPTGADEEALNSAISLCIRDLFFSFKYISISKQ